jgi:glycerol-3-phosphate dehydrogenase
MGLDGFNMRSRSALFARLGQDPFDLLIIGGGITGASIFRDAALRGMKVALVEARDFASGTSSRSSKLIHGGLRYLKNLGVGLAWESCHERNLHVKLNKRLVRPEPFLVPIYRGRGTPRWVLRMGMLLYDSLSGFRNFRCHRFLDREETLLCAPGVPTDGLTGACLYYDAVVSDSRWTLEIVKDGVREGAVALNYAPVVELLKENGRVAGAVVEDGAASGTERKTIRASVTINATGVAADTIRHMDDPGVARSIRLSKGTHLVFAEEDVPLTMTTVFDSPLDRRPLFLVKRDGCFLYGTTDAWEAGDPTDPQPAAKDCRYLLDSLNRFMPKAGLSAGDVQYVYSGFRPLIAPGVSDAELSGNPSRASREDQIEESASGLISVLGGKLTTARLMALRVLKKAIARLGRRWKKSATHLRSIGGTNEEIAEALAECVHECPRQAAYFRTLFQRYGLDARAICLEVMRIHRGEHPDPRAEPIRAEVEYVCRHEMVCTLSDLLDRRAGFLSWNIEKRLERARHGAHVIRKELEWTEEQFAVQYRDYERFLLSRHALPKMTERKEIPNGEC